DKMNLYITYISLISQNVYGPCPGSPDSRQESTNSCSQDREENYLKSKAPVYFIRDFTEHVHTTFP
ncbi:MAG: hypothetical protein ACYTE8_06555, partial [Planctomycetota bacterium]